MDDDTDLLQRFADAHDQAAFAGLVDRHAPLVLGACRRLLGPGPDAEDAAQAAFLVLARQAERIGRGRPLAPWLHRVAVNAARDLERERRARRRREGIAATMRPTMDHDEASGLSEILDRCLADLPERERQAIVLVHLQGLSATEAAQRLRCPKGTIDSWLHRGRERLRARLRRHGVALSATLLLSALGELQAAVPSVGFGASSAAIASAFTSSAPSATTIAAKLAKKGLYAMRTERLLRRGSIAALLIVSVSVAGWLGVTAAESAPAPVPAAEPPRPQPPAAIAWTPPATVVDGIDRFSADLYRQLAAKPGNLACSPFSIHAALAMTSAGARGETLAEMERAAQFPAQNALHDGWKGLRAALAQVLKGPDGKPLWEWTMADALFGAKAYVFVPPFLDCCRSSYGAGFDTLEFKGDNAGAIKAINDWASRQTAGRIPEIVTPIVVLPDTPLVLVNAVRMKARWAEQFEAGLTRPERFHRPGLPDIDAPMMYDVRDLRYADTGAVQVVALPYAGYDLSLVLIVPKAVGLSRVWPRSDGSSTARSSTPWPPLRRRGNWSA